MAQHNEQGRNGEDAARNWLVENGYRILEYNWKFHHLELDIIASKGEDLVIVEVKTRKEDFLLAPEETISKKKIKNIIAAAEAYVIYNNVDLDVRFDIISVIEHTDAYEIEHIEDAFFAPLSSKGGRKR